jgi:hypothetical protein
LLLLSAEYFVFQFYIKNINIKIYRPIILPVVLFGCETWSIPMDKERRQRVFEKRVLRIIFGPEGRPNRGVEKTT